MSDYKRPTLTSNAIIKSHLCHLRPYSIARRHLMKADPRLNQIIKRIGPCELHAVAPRDPFEALCMSIASQQLSVKAAATIFGRFCDLFPSRKPTPERVMTMTDDQIRAVGFSRPKVSFIKDLASHVLDDRSRRGICGRA